MSSNAITSSTNFEEYEPEYDLQEGADPLQYPGSGSPPLFTPIWAVGNDEQQNSSDQNGRKEEFDDQNFPSANGELVTSGSRFETRMPFYENRSNYNVDGGGTAEAFLNSLPDEAGESIYNNETTETTIVTQEFSYQDIEDGKAFIGQMVADGRISEDQASNFYSRNDDNSIDSTAVGQLGQIVGSPRAEGYPADRLRAGEVFTVGVVPGEPQVGGAVGSVDSNLSMEFQNGHISASDFTILANDPTFQSLSANAQNDFVRELRTDWSVDNLEVGREATVDDGNMVTSRDGLLFMMPSDGGNPYFVRGDGTPIPATLQAQADAEGAAGGMSQRTIDAIAVLNGTTEVTPEQQLIIDDYINKSSDVDTYPDQAAVTNEFLGNVQNGILENDGYANGHVENTTPDTVTPFISPGGRDHLDTQVVPEIRADSDFIEDGRTVTDTDGLWGEIQARVDSPQAQQYVYESLTGSLYDTSPSTVPSQPVTINGETIPAGRVEFLDIVAEDAVFQMADREDLDEAGVTQKLQATVDAGGLTQVEADYIEGEIDRLQMPEGEGNPDGIVMGNWTQGATPWLSAADKTGHEANIEEIARTDPEQLPVGVEPEDAYRWAIDSSFPDAPPELKNYLHSEVTGKPYFEDQIALKYDRGEAVSFGIDPLNYGEQQEAEAVISQGMHKMETEGLNAYQLYPELQQSVENGELTEQQTDFIMVVLSSQGTFPTNDSISFSGMYENGAANP